MTNQNQSQKIVKCQNCDQDFRIESEDFVFYDKIQVPPPTFCPECRMRRKMIWRSEVVLYKIKCQAPNHNEEIFSVYPENGLFKIYDHKYWFSDEWDPMNCGRDYDFSRPFFSQLYDLQKAVPRYNQSIRNSVNCDYCGAISYSKNCYLTIGIYDEDCLYSAAAISSKNCVDCWLINACENCYSCINCEKCYNVFFSQYATNCLDSFLLYNCSNCSNCFGCVNLRNKQYYIFNKPYSKEEYFKIVGEYDFSGFNGLASLKNTFNDFKNSYPRRFAVMVNSFNSSGNGLRNTKNCRECFDVLGAEDVKFIILAGLGFNDSYDCVDSGGKASLIYDSVSVGLNTFRVFFSNNITENCHDIYYSDTCRNSSYLFGCVGLNNKEYCIFNKQYSAEEYKNTVSKIIKHMNNAPYISNIKNPSTGSGQVYKYGEFFPEEFCPFGYNKTIAHQYFRLTKNVAIKMGYGWEEPKYNKYKVTLENKSLPDKINDVSDDILNEVIECAHKGGCDEPCSIVFKIIPRELEFYKKHKLPIPRLCPICRHFERIRQCDPVKLWHRQCQCAGTQSDNKVYQNTINHNHHNDNHCPNEFETTYAPERKEIVYCEQCYQQEVA